MDIYFDFKCIFCYRAYRMLNKMKTPEINWIGCEINPFMGEEMPYQSYKILQVFEYLKTVYSKDELKLFMDKVWSAQFKEGKDVNDKDIILTLIEDDESFAVEQILAENSFSEKLRENNKIAYEEKCFQAVPSISYKGKTLEAQYGIGLDKTVLINFLEDV